ncbi:uncharacterized protein RHOBADRAFT_56352 [Rhodotorula graminis WP1]|uniref:25S rRNA (uridine-N(3))-methyltransferase BMT5-like domain-containing protein n=1 Tax=Rhodotorula graminis (strain WP1) TaxID=578459 RepID=A0A0P9GFZ4_RHOGW|nr:uncharacterized protein RHOBADRAFT_56352 [Rhodotorula graminis WP1]KPV71730.1 hypothetical protein RHOBADRAFT_56352 [Rhodotorula graminis WP1]
MPKHAKAVKVKGKLAKALSGQQAVAAKRAHEERARQAEEARQKAVKAKIIAGGAGPGGAGRAASLKKRRLSHEGAAAGDAGAAAGKAGPGEGAQQAARDSVQPFRRGERVLLVGEGNFSFAHSLLLPLSTAAAAAAAAASSSSSTDKPVTAPVPLVTPSLLCCTAFDTEATAAEKYPDLATHVDALRAAGATVLFGIDATKLEEYKDVRECGGLGKGKGKGAERELRGLDEGAGFDKVVFNFPHIGQGVTDQNRNVRLNQTLLIDFYRSAATVLRRGTSRAPGLSKAAKRALEADSADLGGLRDDDDLDRDDVEDLLVDSNGDPLDAPVLLEPPPPTTRGTILLTLRTNAPYSLWLPTQLATKGPLLLPSILPAHALKGGRTQLQPNYRTVRSWAFDPARWEGYEHRRTIGFDEAKSSRSNDDLVLTARERKGKKLGAAVGAIPGASSGAGAGGGAGAGASAAKVGKEDKAPIRTWEFELVRAEPDEPAGDKGWGQRAAFKKRRAEEDPDLSD